MHGCCVHALQPLPPPLHAHETTMPACRSRKARASQQGGCWCPRALRFAAATCSLHPAPHAQYHTHRQGCGQSPARPHHVLHLLLTRCQPRLAHIQLRSPGGSRGGTRSGEAAAGQQVRWTCAMTQQGGGCVRRPDRSNTSSSAEAYGAAGRCGSLCAKASQQNERKTHAYLHLLRKPGQLLDMGHAETLPPVAAPAPAPATTTPPSRHLPVRHGARRLHRQLLQPGCDGRQLRLTCTQPH